MSDVRNKAKLLLTNLQTPYGTGLRPVSTLPADHEPEVYQYLRKNKFVEENYGGTAFRITNKGIDFLET